MNPNCKGRSHQRKLIAALVKCLIILAVCGAVGWGLAPLIVNEVASQLLTLSPGRELYSLVWLHPPIPIFLKVRIFNVTNPQDIEAGGKPVYQELGPYVFDEIRHKNNVTLDDERDTATYLEHVRYQFREDLSGDRKLSDVVTIINVPFVAAAMKVDSLPWPINHMALMIILNFKEPLFVEKTVEQLLFEGWKVPFLEEIEDEIGFSFLPNNTFAYLMGWNDSYRGPFTVQRASRGDKRLVGNTIEYKHNPSWMVWGKENSSCNQLRGTDAFIYPPFNTKETQLSVYDKEACGTLDLHYKTDNVSHEGIQGYRYYLPASELRSPRVYPKNECYCSHMARGQPEKCYADGVLDLGPCRNGDPVGLSLPHFLYADPLFLGAVGGGLDPDEEKHSCFVEVEPFTGMALQARKRFQLNLILKPVSGIPSLRKVPEMFFPLFWSGQTGNITPEMGDHLKQMLLPKTLVEKGVPFLCILIATFCTVVLMKQVFEETGATCGDDACSRHNNAKSKKLVTIKRGVNALEEEETSEERSDLMNEEEKYHTGFA